MATNPYINYFNAKNEQSLTNNLVIEAIKMYGIDIIYLPRTVKEEDKLLHEDALAVFEKTIPIEVYIKTVDGFGGEGDILSKFGLAIRDSMVLCMSITRAKEELGKERRPMEGDLIYFPINKKLFEVMHVEHESVFYQNGGLQFYDINVELFEFSNESFYTGVDEIDSIYEKFNTSHEEAIKDLDVFNDAADNEYIQSLSDDLLDFSRRDPYSKDGKW